MKKILISTMFMALSFNSAWAMQCQESDKITKSQIESAQQQWASGIVNIGTAKDAKTAASNHLDTLYAYDMGTVLFKPTKAEKDQFRGTKTEALSYFVGGENPEDKGFALAPFTNVRFENEATIIDCDSALAMGNYYFTTTDKQNIKVEYTFGYVKDAKNSLKINLHHSSLPYHH